MHISRSPLVYKGAKKMDIIPISQNIIQPVIKTNIDYVNSIEEFEKIELEPNQTILCFDNKRPCFYIRERDKFGEYCPAKVFFYEDFATKMQSADNKVFYDALLLSCGRYFGELAYFVYHNLNKKNLDFHGFFFS
jgi:hypothetical protein